MAAMGFSAQTYPFRPSSFAPPFWFSYSSCPHTFSKSRSFWAASRKVLGRREDYDALATYMPFFVRNMHQGIVNAKMDAYMHSTECCPPSGTWEDEIKAYRIRKKEYESRLSKDGSEYQTNQQGANHGLAHQWASSSPQLHIGHIDSTSCLRNHNPVSAGNQDLGTAFVLHHENPRNSNAQCRPFETATNEQKRYEQSNGKFRGSGYSNVPNSHFRTFDTSTGQKKKYFQNAGQFEGPGYNGVPNCQSRPFDTSTGQTKKYVQNVGQFRSPGYNNEPRSKHMFSKNGRKPSHLVEQPLQKGSPSNGYLSGRSLPQQEIINWPERSLQGVEIMKSSWDEENGENEIENDSTPSGSVGIVAKARKKQGEKGLGIIYDKVLIVDNTSTADAVVSMLTNQYKHLVHACDTEVAKIDVKQETPVDHGEIICFSIYCGPEADFGNGKSCIWVDVLNGGGKDLLARFEPFFKDPSIQKVWHNYSFDVHVIENYGLFKVAGFHADTMHMARLWNSSRRTEGGYSLESLTCDRSVMSDVKLSPGEELIGKVSMKTIFGQKKVKKDGSEGKVTTIPSVEELQTEKRELWIGYSALDSISTLRLYQSLKSKLSKMEWKLDGVRKGNMFNFYEEYWRPFGELLVRMETDGMLVDRSYLAEIEKVAIAEQQIAADRFRNWAAKYCPDAKYMNVGSDSQLRVLFFGGIQNRKDANEFLDKKKNVQVLNIDKVIEEGKKAPKKFRTITLNRLFDEPLKTDIYTASGWPSVSGDALKALARRFSEESEGEEGDHAEDIEKSGHSRGKQAIEASQAISALCEVCSIDSLISNFILPLQGSSIAGNTGRVHCSLNINTETGRLSARRPNLQNQPALEKDRYKIRQAFIAAPGNSLIVADYGQLELRILAHLARCKSMLAAFEAGGDFHSRTAMNMYPHIRKAIEQKHVLLEWHPQPGEDKPPVPLLKDAFASERRKAKMLNFSIAYGKTPVGLARDWKVSVEEARNTVNLWYSDRKEVLSWQEKRKAEAREKKCVHTLLGRARRFPSQESVSATHRGHIERAAINTPVQGSAADVAMCAMLEISRNKRLKELGWKLLLQVHDEVILEGPTESAEIAKAIVVKCMSQPFNGKNILEVDLSVDAKFAQNWYAAK